VIKFQEQFRHLPTGSDKNDEKLDESITNIQVTRIAINNVTSHIYPAMKINTICSQLVTT
jgi:hypothetical protein